MSVSLRELLDNHAVVSLKTLSGYVSKKYVNGKRNTGIPHKIKSMVSFRKPVPSGHKWHNDGLDPDNSSTFMYLSENLIENALVSMHIDSKSFGVSWSSMLWGGSNGSRPKDKNISIDLSSLHDTYDVITDDVYFSLSTAIDLHGLTKNELHYVLKISKAMKDL